MNDRSNQINLKGLIGKVTAAGEVRLVCVRSVLIWIVLNNTANKYNQSADAHR